MQRAPAPPPPQLECAEERLAILVSNRAEQANDDVTKRRSQETEAGAGVRSQKGERRHFDSFSFFVSDSCICVLFGDIE